MSIQWLIGNKHKIYGEVVSCGTIAGEPYRWITGERGGMRVVSVVPLAELGENDVTQVIDIETKVIQVIAAVLGKEVNDFNCHDDLGKKHGVESFVYMAIQIGLEDEFNIKFPCSLNLITNTVQQVIDYVEKQTKATVKKSTLDPYAKDEVEKDGFITVHGLE